MHVQIVPNGRQSRDRGRQLMCRREAWYIEEYDRAILQRLAPLEVAAFLINVGTEGGTLGNILRRKSEGQRFL